MRNENFAGQGIFAVLGCLGATLHIAFWGGLLYLIYLAIIKLSS